ncbi:winged-helix domain-containing protein, partial [Hominenteromicrobium sp.]
MVNRSISKQTLLRLPLYLNYMKQLGENTPEHISATTIAEALRLNHVVV